MRQFAEVTNKKYAANKAGQQDVLRAQVEYSKLSNMVILYEQEAKIAENLLKARRMSEAFDDLAGICEDAA